MNDDRPTLYDFWHGEPVTAVCVPVWLRHLAPQRHFGRLLIEAECTVDGFLHMLCDAYRGGFWQYYKLSNGGFYMAPESSEPMRLAVKGNGFAGSMSADAAGIVACLFAFSNLSFKDEDFAELYHQLRAYAGDHPEGVSIFEAID